MVSIEISISKVAQGHFKFSGTLGILIVIVHLITSQPGGYPAYGKLSMGKLKRKQAIKKYLGKFSKSLFIVFI